MISYLNGIIIEMELNANLTATAIVDVNGVGYQVLFSKQLASTLEANQKSAITIYTEVKEDAIRLFGFADKLEKQTFLLLNEVKGIGPKSAIEVLSKIQARELLSIIGHGDLARLKSVKGLGSKTAERIVVELKEKVAKFVSGFLSISSEESSSVSLSKSITKHTASYDDAQLALLALGFGKLDAQKAVQAVEKSNTDSNSNGVIIKDTGDIVREALKHL